jgi:hypothetical protein
MDGERVERERACGLREIPFVFFGWDVRVCVCNCVRELLGWSPLLRLGGGRRACLGVFCCTRGHGLEKLLKKHYRGAAAKPPNTRSRHSGTDRLSHTLLGRVGREAGRGARGGCL